MGPSEDINDHRCVTVEALAERHFVSTYTVFKVLKEDLGLVKKSARWVPKLLTEEQKAERVRCSNLFLEHYIVGGKDFLDKIITMNESAICLHTAETKRQSKQWLKKGTPSPVKAKMVASRTKKMVLAFFDSKGLIYTNIVPKGETVNAEYIISALKLFWGHLCLKRPELHKNRFIFHWDNAPVHTAQKVKQFLANKKNMEILEHPPIARIWLLPTTSSSPR